MDHNDVADVDDNCIEILSDCMNAKYEERDVVDDEANEADADDAAD